MNWRLVVFSSVSHYGNDQVTAHAGFVKELDIWAKIFPEVLVVTVHDTGKPMEDAIPYNSPNVKFLWLDNQVATTGVKGKFILSYKLLQWYKKSIISLRPHDIIMARGPDGMGFLGFLVSKLKRVTHFAKYADQWQNFKNEPVGYRLQKFVYRSRFFDGPVQIYGPADKRRPHLVPFFTSSISEKDWIEAGELSSGRKFSLPFRLLFVGRLVEAKGVDLIISAVDVLIRKGYDVLLEVVGDGPELIKLQNQSQELGISGRVNFPGRLGWQDLKQHYALSHSFIHASRKEGFGKVLLEAMTFGLPIIGTDVGISREILNPPICGCMVPSEDVTSLTDQIVHMINNYQDYLKMGENARSAVKQYLLENVEIQYRDFVNKYLQMDCS